MTEVKGLIVDTVNPRNVLNAFKGKCVADIHMDVEHQCVILTFTDGTFSEIRMFSDSSDYNTLDFARTDANGVFHYLDAGLLGSEEEHYREKLRVEDEEYMRGIEVQRYLELKEKYDLDTTS